MKKIHNAIRSLRQQKHDSSAFLSSSSQHGSKTPTPSSHVRDRKASASPSYRERSMPKPFQHNASDKVLQGKKSSVQVDKGCSAMAAVPNSRTPQQRDLAHSQPREGQFPYFQSINKTTERRNTPHFRLESKKSESQRDLGRTQRGP